MTVQSLSTKLQDTNKNYLYAMPDWLKIMFTITSTIISIMVIVVLICAKKSGNCLLRKHLGNNRKNKNTDFHEFELREMSKSHSISTSPP